MPFESLLSACRGDYDLSLSIPRKAGLLPLLISIVGQEAAGDLLLSRCQQLGLDTLAADLQHRLPGLCMASM